MLLTARCRGDKFLPKGFTFIYDDAVELVRFGSLFLSPLVS